MPYTPPSWQSSVSSTSTANSTFTHTFPHINHPQDGPPPSPGSQRALPRSSSSSSSARAEMSRDTLRTQLPKEMAQSKKFSLGEMKQPADDGVGPHQGCQHQGLYSQAPEPASSEESVSSVGCAQDSSSSEDPEGPQENSGVENIGKAVRLSLDTARGGSPESSNANSPQNEVGSECASDFSEPGRLSATARRISHSRSSTESAIMFPSSSAPDLTVLAASEGSEEEDSDSDSRSSGLRKKSGELVKPAIRPPNRRKVSSMPGTPTFSKKGVHFNDDLQQVRHFLQVDRPIAVSAGGSPVETFAEETEFPFSRNQTQSKTIELRLGNFPRESHERQSLPVRLERINLSFDQKTLLGSVAVANLAFHKVVAARFTFDNWRTVSEVTAEYGRANVEARSRASGYDLFDFNIKLSEQANLEKKIMLICIRYQVAGNEFWDNNGSRNFKVEFVKRDAPKDVLPQTQPTGPKPIPRSRHNSPSSQGLRPSPLIHDDFATGFESFPAFIGGSSIPKGRVMPETPPPRRQHKSGQPFGNRYDFGASLSAALTNAQSQLGEKNGTGTRSEHGSAQPTSNSQQGGARPPTTRTVRQYPVTSGTESPRPDSLLANKQSVDSRAYQEFVSKFCFFGSGKPQVHGSQASNVNNGSKKGISSGDGTQDEVQAHRGSDSEQISGTSQAAAQGHLNAPERFSDFMLAPQLPTAHEPHPTAPKSPSQQPRCGSNSSSPIALGYPYREHQPDMFPYDPNSIPAIHG